jgi:hypothetical protein
LKVKLDLTEQTLAYPREAPASSAAIANTETPRRKPASDGSNTLLVTSVVVTAAFAVATGTLAWLALDAKKRFESDLGTFQTNKATIEDSRSRMKTYAYVTDGLGAATVISGGVALYLALTGNSSQGKRKDSANNRSIVLVPTLDGMAIHGSW